MLEIKRDKTWAWVDQSRHITPTALVLHYWGSTVSKQGVAGLERIWAPPSYETGLSAQFLVLNTPAILQCVETPTVWCRHAKEANESGIAIEIQGGPEDLDANQAQFEQVVELVRYLKQTYGIEDDFRVTGIGTSDIRFYGVATHQMVDAFCLKRSAKVDVHLEYYIRVIEALRSSQ